MNYPLKRSDGNGLFPYTNYAEFRAIVEEDATEGNVRDYEPEVVWALLSAYEEKISQVAELEAERQTGDGVCPRHGRVETTAVCGLCASVTSSDADKQLQNIATSQGLTEASDVSIMRELARLRQQLDVFEQLEEEYCPNGDNLRDAFSRLNAAIDRGNELLDAEYTKSAALRAQMAALRGELEDRISLSYELKAQIAKLEQQVAALTATEVE